MTGLAFKSAGQAIGREENAITSSVPLARQARGDPRADAIFRKIAWRLMPLLLACYILALIDRTNVGYAKLQFMQDLGFDEAAYGFGAGIFFLGYLLFEIPSNLMLHRIGLRRTLSRIMILWGSCTIALAFMASATSFATLRFLLGAAEAGLFPGLILYLTYWIPSRRRAWFTAIIMSCPGVAGVISAALAGAIMSAGDDGFGLHGWQWLFICEGVPTVALGLAALACLTDRPEGAAWLTDCERSIVAAEIEADGRPARKHGHATVLAAIRAPRFLVLLFCSFALYASTATSTFWGASIVRDAGSLSVLQTALAMALANAIAVVLQLWIARRSDRMRERHWHTVACVLLAAVGWLALPNLPPDDFVWSLLALTLCIAGTTSAFAPFFSLPPAYLTAAAAPPGIAIVTSVGSSAGFIVPLVMGRLASGSGSMALGEYMTGSLLVAAAILLPLSLARTDDDGAGGIRTYRLNG